jgi:hypothetical protein
MNLSEDEFKGENEEEANQQMDDDFVKPLGFAQVNKRITVIPKLY